MKAFWQFIQTANYNSCGSHLQKYYWNLDAYSITAFLKFILKYCKIWKHKVQKIIWNKRIKLLFVTWRHKTGGKLQLNEKLILI